MFYRNAKLFIVTYGLLGNATGTRYSLLSLSQITQLVYYRPKQTDDGIKHVIEPASSDMRGPMALMRSCHAMPCLLFTFITVQNAVHFILSPHADPITVRRFLKYVVESSRKWWINNSNEQVNTFFNTPACRKVDILPVLRRWRFNIRNFFQFYSKQYACFAIKKFI